VLVEMISMSSTQLTLEGYCCGEHSNLPSKKPNVILLGLLAGKGDIFLLPPLAFRAFFFEAPGFVEAIGVNPGGVVIVDAGGVSVVVIVSVSSTVTKKVLKTVAVSNTVDVLLYVSVT
jgi:hypothetical protein